MESEDGGGLALLEERLLYTFRRRELLDRAVTHRSFANEQTGTPLEDNEALEFLGDAVLGFLISAWLLERFPRHDEGKLSKLKAHLVSAETLEIQAQTLQLGEFLRLNRGEEKTGGRAKRTLLVGAYEALIAAIYLDGGIEAAHQFLRRSFRSIIAVLDPEITEALDFKTTLQERLQARGMAPPRYEVVEKVGPAHDRLFHVQVRFEDRFVADGVGRKIKDAHQQAARMALQKLDQLPPGDPGPVPEAKDARDV
ncbi:MAG: ribonuclease III [Acidobacteria bacterium]|nr:ribonuclease III [Acidobacteriota bacterium]